MGKTTPAGGARQRLERHTAGMETQAVEVQVTTMTLLLAVGRFGETRAGD